MTKIWSNIFLLLLSMALIIWFIISVYSPNFATKWPYKIEGLILHVIGSIIFVVLIFIILKHSISISKYIAILPANEEPEHMRIKVINYSLFEAHDLQINIYKIDRINISGSDVKATLLGHYEGMAQGINYLKSGFKSMFDSTKTNAIQLRVNSVLQKENGDQIIKDILASQTSYLEIHISLRHGLSGIVGHVVKRYNNSLCVKNGVFKHGFSLAIDS